MVGVVDKVVGGEGYCIRRSKRSRAGIRGQKYKKEYKMSGETNLSYGHKRVKKRLRKRHVRKQTSTFITNFEGLGGRIRVKK